MIDAQFDELVSKISSNYEAEEIFVTKPFGHFPNRDAIISIIKDVRSLIFPGYYAGEALKGVGAENYVAEQIMRIRNALRTQVHEAFLFRDGTTLPTHARGLLNGPSAVLQPRSLRRNCLSIGPFRRPRETSH